MYNNLPKKDLLGVGFTDKTESEVLEYVLNFINVGKGKLFITTPNPEILVHAKHHQLFMNTLNSSQISLADGIGIFVAGKLLGQPLKSRIPGIDFMKNLCKMVEDQPITVGFLGGKGDVALRAAECLREEFPKLKILLSEAGNPDAKTAKMIRDRFFKKQQLDILFVGYGFPKQEEWIAQHLASLPVRVAMTVGGSFDILSNSLPRAPRLFRYLGLEWLWRLGLQPKRITRQIKLLEFVYLVLKEGLTQ